MKMQGRNRGRAGTPCLLSVSSKQKKSKLVAMKMQGRNRGRARYRGEVYPFNSLVVILESLLCTQRVNPFGTFRT